MLTPDRSHSIGQARNFLLTFWACLVVLPIPILLAEFPKLDPNRRSCGAICAVVTAIFLMRWAVGNTGYLRETFCSTAPWIQRSLERTGALTAHQVACRLIFDLGLLLLHGAGLCWMAFSISNSTSFLYALEFLLVTNLFWLFYEPRVWPKVAIIILDVFAWKAIHSPDPRRPHLLRVRWDADYAPRTWTWNNTITALLVMGTSYTARRVAGEEGCLIILIITVVSGAINSYLDWHHTHCGALGTRC